MATRERLTEARSIFTLTLGLLIFLLMIFFIQSAVSDAQLAASDKSKKQRSNSPDTNCWVEVPSPNVETSSSLLGVAAVGSNDVWAVGWCCHATRDRTLIEHWDGTSWSVVPSPNPGDFDNFLYGVAAVSANDVWAVGYYAHVLYAPDRTLIEHWDGASWSVVPSPSSGFVNNDLFGITALSASDLWTVGDYSPPGGPGWQTLVEHWDGSTWSIVRSPYLDSESELRGIAAISVDDLWAVGDYRAGGTGRTLAEHYESCYAPPTPGATPTSCPIQFSDVPPGSTYYDYVRCLACRGIVSGYPDDTFRPNNLVTRGQACKIDILAAGLIFPIPSDRQTFEDVPPGSTFWLYVERAYAYGVVAGYPCGASPDEPCIPPLNRPYFRPNGLATRGQAAKIIELTSGFEDPPNGQAFQDVSWCPTTCPFYSYVQVLAQHSIVSGYPCGNPEPCWPPENKPYFRPGNLTTRGQFAK